MKLKKLLAPAIIVLLFAACKTSDKLALQLNYQKGKKYYYTQVSEQSIDQTVMGKTIQTKSTTTTGYIWEIKDIDKNGDFNVTITYDKMETKKEGAGADQKSPIGDDFLKGFSFDMVVTPKGKVKEVRGMDKIFDKAMDAAMPDSLKNDPTTQSMMGPMKEMMKKQFSDKSMGSMMEQMTNYFPEGDVEVGDKWSNVVNNTTILPMKISTDYQVKDIKDNVATIDIESKIEPGEGEGIMGMKTELTGTQKGTMEIDTKTGIIIKNTITQDMSGTMSMMGMSFPMKISGKVSIEGKEMN